MCVKLDMRKIDRILQKWREGTQIDNMAVHVFMPDVKLIIDYIDYLRENEKKLNKALGIRNPGDE